MKKELWQALRTYRFDDLVPPHLADRVATLFAGSDPSTRAFAGKIARKHEWPLPFALRAIAEYKKFVYLGMISNVPVTPPRVIDAVWHEHLLFSRAYREFCARVLGRDFDHNPELVPEREQTDVFRAQYAATIALYEAEFRAAPPADIWGTPKFAPAGVHGPDARRTTRPDGSGSVGYAAGYEGDHPLHAYYGGFDGEGPTDFGGGGGFSGGGGGANWSDDSSADGSAGGSSDGGGSDGGSGCSSGCGGGGE